MQWERASSEPFFYFFFCCCCPCTDSCCENKMPWLSFLSVPEFDLLVNCLFFFTFSPLSYLSFSFTLFHPSCVASSFPFLLFLCLPFPSLQYPLLSIHCRLFLLLMLHSLLFLLFCSSPPHHCVPPSLSSAPVPHSRSLPYFASPSHSCLLLHSSLASPACLPPLKTHC